MTNIKTFNLTIWFKDSSHKTFNNISRIASCRYIDFYWQNNENYSYWSVEER